MIYDTLLILFKTYVVYGAICVRPILKRWPVSWEAEKEMHAARMKRSVSSSEAARACDALGVRDKNGFKFSGGF